MPAVHVRLVWLLLALTLLQAWGAATHVHGLDDRHVGAVTGEREVGATDARQAAIAQTVTDAGTPTGPEAPVSETECHCIWCAPRLHVLLAFSLPRPEPPSAAHLPPVATPSDVARLPEPHGPTSLPRGPPA